MIQLIRNLREVHQEGKKTNISHPRVYLSILKNANLLQKSPLKKVLSLIQCIGTLCYAIFQTNEKTKSTKREEISSCQKL